MQTLARLAPSFCSAMRVGRMSISTTSVLMERFNILVPPMGESIKSGAINMYTTDF